MNMNNLLILCGGCLAMLICFSGCSPTIESQRAQKRLKERQTIYSQQAGKLYRQPPTHEPLDLGPPRLPEGMALSYSPITGETVLVPKRHPTRLMPAKRRSKEVRNQMVASYSPLTGEAIWVPRNPG